MAFTEEQIQAEIRRQRAERKRRYYKKNPASQREAQARWERKKAMQALEARQAEGEG